jgi:hypothetical protein
MALKGRLTSGHRLSCYFGRPGKLRTPRLSAKFRRGVPDQMPLLLIGRFAVDAHGKAKVWGRRYWRTYCDDIPQHPDRRRPRVVAHAVDETAVSFYERDGCMRSPLGERVMGIQIETVRSLVRK